MSQTKFSDFQLAGESDQSCRQRPFSDLAKVTPFRCVLDPTQTATASRNNRNMNAENSSRRSLRAAVHTRNWNSITHSTKPNRDQKSQNPGSEQIQAPVVGVKERSDYGKARSGSVEQLATLFARFNPQIAWGELLIFSQNIRVQVENGRCDALGSNWNIEMRGYRIANDRFVSFKTGRAVIRHKYLLHQGLFRRCLMQTVDDPALIYRR